MADIYIKFKGHGVVSKDIKTITTDNIKSVSAKFEFDEDWEEYTTKVAIFTINEDIAFKTYLDENNSCIVPWEALRRPCNIYVGVVGFNEDKTYTSVLVPAKIYQGSNIDAEDPCQPTMNIIAQIEALRAQVKELKDILPLSEDESLLILDGGII